MVWSTKSILLIGSIAVTLNGGTFAWLSIRRTDSSRWKSHAPPKDVRYPSLVTTLANENAARNFNERIVREELQVRNSDIPNEERYAVADGSGLERLNDPVTETTIDTNSIHNNNNAVVVTVATEQLPSNTVEAAATDTHNPISSSSSSNNNNKLLSKMERMIQPRAYPLFLLEKATEIIESAWQDVTTAAQHVITAVNEANNGPSIDSSSTPTTTTTTSSSTTTTTKERIVLLGTGWGAASFLKEIDTNLYDVTVVSPRNHFVFTPMLAGACVGTVEIRSLCEPIREINRHVDFLEATAVHVNPQTQSVTCDAVVCEGNSCTIDSFPLSYDRLIVGVGAQTNTFGIPGVKERCNFLKSVPDARRIKSAIVNCFERANLPHLTEDEKIHGLTFAVIGAGPTGIEFAAELRDFVEQDGPKYYPNLLKYVRIKVIEASPTILAPFDKSLQEEAIKQMQRQMVLPNQRVRDLLPERFELVELLLQSSVSEVGEDIIHLNDGKKIPYGLAVWAAGNGPIPLTLQIIEALGNEQAPLQSVGRGRIAIDPWMRAVGGMGRIFSLGDCSCIVGVGGGTYNSDETNSLALPATAQVASQQGEYLGKLFNKQYDVSPERTAGIVPPPTKIPDLTVTSLSDSIAGMATANWNGEFAKPFQFLNLGILAYTGGGSALAQVVPAPNAAPVKGSGKLGNAVWRSVYLSKQISWRNRLLVLNDWTNRQFFGRDITRL